MHGRNNVFLFTITTVFFVLAVVVVDAPKQMTSKEKHHVTKHGLLHGNKNAANFDAQAARIVLATPTLSRFGKTAEVVGIKTDEQQVHTNNTSRKMRKKSLTISIDTDDDADLKDKLDMFFTKYPQQNAVASTSTTPIESVVADASSPTTQRHRAIAHGTSPFRTTTRDTKNAFMMRLVNKEESDQPCIGYYNPKYNTVHEKVPQFCYDGHSKEETETSPSNHTIQNDNQSILLSPHLLDQSSTTQAATTTTLEQASPLLKQQQQQQQQLDTSTLLPINKSTTSSSAGKHRKHNATDKHHNYTQKQIDNWVQHMNVRRSRSLSAPHAPLQAEEHEWGGTSSFVSKTKIRQLPRAQSSADYGTYWPDCDPLRHVHTIVTAVPYDKQLDKESVSAVAHAAEKLSIDAGLYNPNYTSILPASNHVHVAIDKTIDRKDQRKATRTGITHMHVDVDNNPMLQVPFVFPFTLITGTCTFQNVHWHANTLVPFTCQSTTSAHAQAIGPRKAKCASTNGLPCSSIAIA